MLVYSRPSNWAIFQCFMEKIQYRTYFVPMKTFWFHVIMRKFHGFIAALIGRLRDKTAISSLFSETKMFSQVEMFGIVDTYVYAYV